MRVTVTPNIIGALDTLINGLVLGLEGLHIMGWVETIQTTSLLRSAEILPKVQEIEETCYHSNSSERSSEKVNEKTLTEQYTNDNLRNQTNKRDKHGTTILH